MSDATVDRLTLGQALAQIERAQAETRKFVAEQGKLMAEQSKLNAEAEKLRRDRALVPWQFMVTLLGAGAAAFAAGATFWKVIGH